MEMGRDGYHIYVRGSEDFPHEFRGIGIFTLCVVKHVILKEGLIIICRGCESRGLHNLSLDLGGDLQNLSLELGGSYEICSSN